MMAISNDKQVFNGYWCFISYRHADNHEQDRQWATWLLQEIEYYEIPAEILGTTNQRGDVMTVKIYPVFRDEESLSAEAHLGTAIMEALDASQTLVVLCSPRAVDSHYIISEITRFQQTGKGDHIITAIIDGEPNGLVRECFPEPFRKSPLEDGFEISRLRSQLKLPRFTCNNLSNFIIAESNNDIELNNISSDFKCPIISSIDKLRKISGMTINSAGKIIKNSNNN